MEGEKVSTAEASGKDSKHTRQRSTIGFPYTDLAPCVGMAEAIHAHVGLGDCDDHQLAAWTGQSAKSSGFRVQVYAARTFGILVGEGGRHKLTDLGRAIVDPNQMREAKACAFLAVPLFKSVYEQYKGGVIPPAAALERDMATLGVSDKQKGRARQVFEKSAEESGFFEQGNNRLVMPGVQLRKSKADESKGKGDGDGGDGVDDLGLDPLLIALLRKIPSTEKGWPASQRVRWFRTFAMNVSQIYDTDEEPVEIEIKITDTKE